MRNIFVILLLFVFLYPFAGNYAQPGVASVDSLYLHSDTSGFAAIKTIPDLARRVAAITPEKSRQLWFLALWARDYMHADAERFFKGGMPLSVEEAFAARKGLCDEYANLVQAFCNQLSIPNFRVEGYVRYMGQDLSHGFDEPNHAWNLVLIGSEWKLCDLFWTTQLLKKDRGQGHFESGFNPRYFLSGCDEFTPDHLPVDPVFQLKAYPVELKTFVNDTNMSQAAIEERQPLAFLDSLSLYQKLRGQELQLRIAQHGFSFNPDNPNTLIATYFNQAADLVAQSKPSVMSLRQARDYFTRAIVLMEQSKKEQIKALRQPALETISSIDKRLQSNKK